MSLFLPPELLAPIPAGDEPLTKLVYILTLYIKGPSAEELEVLLDLYERLCPPESRRKYCTREAYFWYDVDRPLQTLSTEAALAAGAKRPYLAPVLKRIAEGRDLELKLWDKRELADPKWTWSLALERTHGRKSGLRGFLQILLPLDSDPALLLELANGLMGALDFHSGHGGPGFILKDILTGRWNLSILEAVAPFLARYPGLGLCYPERFFRRAAKGIETVNWLTLLGPDFAARPEALAGLDRLAAAPEVAVEHHGRGTLIVAGPAPVTGAPGPEGDGLAPYRAVARALAPLQLEEQPPFLNQPFPDEAWFRRFQ